MKPSVYLTDDGEQVIEFIGDNARFSLWFDGEGESSWSYVTKSGEMHGEFLNEDVILALQYGLRLYEMGKRP